MRKNNTYKHQINFLFIVEWFRRWTGQYCQPAEPADTKSVLQGQQLQVRVGKDPEFGRTNTIFITRIRFSKDREEALPPALHRIDFFCGGGEG